MGTGRRRWYGEEVMVWGGDDGYGEEVMVWGGDDGCGEEVMVWGGDDGYGEILVWGGDDDDGSKGHILSSPDLELVKQQQLVSAPL